MTDPTARINTRWEPHLPECWMAEGKFDALCMCDRLRACKERVENRFHFYTGPDVYAAALEAAREAISPLLHEEPCDCDNCRLITTAQALIAALRSEPALLAQGQEPAYQSEQP